MSNSLDPDQAPCFVWPDMGPKCLQRLSAYSKGTNSGERVKALSKICSRGHSIFFFFIYIFFFNFSEKIKLDMYFM